MNNIQIQMGGWVRENEVFRFAAKGQPIRRQRAVLVSPIVVNQEDTYLLLIIDRKAREIIRLVASVRPFVWPSADAHLYNDL